MASLFKLRRLDSADVFSRWYTTSGMFLRVKVVGIVFSNHFATIMVSIHIKVKQDRALMQSATWLKSRTSSQSAGYLAMKKTGTGRFFFYHLALPRRG